MGLPVYVVSILIEVTGGSPVPKGHLFTFIFKAILTLTFTVEGTVRPDWISLRVVSFGYWIGLKKDINRYRFLIF
jgi:hypothetical protein